MAQLQIKSVARKTLMEEFSTNAKSSTVENIYFSDHDAVRFVTDKNAAYFHFSENGYAKGQIRKWV